MYYWYNLVTHETLKNTFSQILVTSVFLSTWMLPIPLTKHWRYLTYLDLSSEMFLMIWKRLQCIFSMKKWETDSWGNDCFNNFTMDITKLFYKHEFFVKFLYHRNYHETKLINEYLFSQKTYLIRNLTPDALCTRLK